MSPPLSPLTKLFSHRHPLSRSFSMTERAVVEANFGQGTTASAAATVTILTERRRGKFWEKKGRREKVKTKWRIRRKKKRNSATFKSTASATALSALINWSVHSASHHRHQNDSSTIGKVKQVQVQVQRFLLTKGYNCTSKYHPEQQEGPKSPTVDSLTVTRYVGKKFSSCHNNSNSSSNNNQIPCHSIARVIRDTSRTQIYWTTFLFAFLLANLSPTQVPLFSCAFATSSSSLANSFSPSSSSSSSHSPSRPLPSLSTIVTNSATLSAPLPPLTPIIPTQSIQLTIDQRKLQLQPQTQQPVHTQHHHHHYLRNNINLIQEQQGQLLPSPEALLASPASSSSSSSSSASPSSASSLHQLPKHNATILNVLIGTTAKLPCDLTPPSEGGIVQLILWYKSSNGTGPPIYTVDARNSSRTSQSSISSSSFSLLLPSATSSSSSSLNTPHHLLKATHFIPDAYKDRLHFNLSVNSPSVLTITSVRDEDSSDYSCRVSYTRCHTLTEVMMTTAMVMMLRDVKRMCDVLTWPS